MAKHAKMKELILYICEKLKDDPHFDEEKLSATLFLCDFTMYRNTAKSITGETYWKT